MPGDGRRRWRGLGAAANVALVGLGLVLALIVVGPFVYTKSPTLVVGSDRLKPPSLAHPLGTDQFGREVLARVMAGGQQSLRVAGLTMALTVLAGSALGLVAGYVRALDDVLMRISDAFLALPAVILAIALMAVREPSEGNVVVALVVVYTPRMARLVRGKALLIVERGMKAFATDPATIVVQAFRHAVKEEGGDDGVDMMRGWGDVEFVATDHRVPTIYFGPGTVAAAHTADEYIDLDRYHMGVTVYERAIQEFLGTA